jgi:mannosyltransferase
MSTSLQGRKGFTWKKYALFSDKSNIWLIVILIIAAFLRFLALDKQSLWLDELHTMNEAAPGLALKDMFLYLSCCDQHPPLYFLLEKLLFIVFGHTSMVARLLSAVLGVGSVWLMYLLGKELAGKRLGLIAAAITCVNYYNLQYSQEARDYIMAFFFSALSYLFFFRLIKTGGRKNIWLYSLSALGVMYSHYYGLFLVTGQFVTVGILWILEKSDRKQLFRTFLICAIIIVAGYLPWLPFLKDMAQIKTFWIGSIDSDFVQKFFYGYFGNSGLLNPFLIFALIYFAIHAMKVRLPFPATVRSSTLQLSFITFFFTILLTYGIPYLRSILVVPMLFDRYTIVILPACIMAIAFGFDLIPSNALRTILITAFLVLSLIDIFFRIKFYTTIRKTQFRELTEYIVKDKRYQFPIVNQRTSWQHQYYLDHYHYKGRVLVGQKDAMVDSILSKSSPAYNLPGFWIIGAHGNETKISDASRAALDTAYDLVKQKDFHDAWAQLYISKHSMAEKDMVIGLDKFPNNITTLDKERFAAVWGGAITSLPIAIKAGRYNMDIMSKGFPSQNIFPHLKVYVNDQLIGDFFTTAEIEENDFDFEIKNNTDALIKIELDNDFADASGDRNAFVSRIIISKK